MDFEQRRERRRERVEHLERRLKRIRRSQRRRDRRRIWRPLRNLALLIGLGALAWIFLPRFFDDGAIADQVAGAREEARQEVKDLQDEILTEVADAVGVEVQTQRDPLELDGEVIDGWTAPLARIDPDRATRPHHTYAAWDYGTRVGTPVFAMTDGQVLRATADDGARCGGMVVLRTARERADITYCHLSEVLPNTGDGIVAGERLGLTGGTPGAPGAGRSSGPHLHLQITLDGTLHCPQAQLVALDLGAPLSVEELPTSGCWYDPSALRSSSDAFASPDQQADTSDPLFEWDP